MKAIERVKKNVLKRLVGNLTELERKLTQAVEAELTRSTLPPAMVETMAEDNINLRIYLNEVKRGRNPISDLRVSLDATETLINNFDGLAVDLCLYGDLGDGAEDGNRARLADLTNFNKGA
jgi:hypothetical protein